MLLSHDYKLNHETLSFPSDLRTNLKPTKYKDIHFVSGIVHKLCHCLTVAKQLWRLTSSFFHLSRPQMVTKFMKTLFRNFTVEKRACVCIHLMKPLVIVAGQLKFYGFYGLT